MILNEISEIIFNSQVYCIIPLILTSYLIIFKFSKTKIKSFLLSTFFIVLFYFFLNYITTSENHFIKIIRELYSILLILILYLNLTIIFSKRLNLIELYCGRNDIFKIPSKIIYIYLLASIFIIVINYTGILNIIDIFLNLIIFICFLFFSSVFIICLLEFSNLSYKKYMRIILTSKLKSFVFIENDILESNLKFFKECELFNIDEQNFNFLILNYKNDNVSYFFKIELEDSLIKIIKANYLNLFLLRTNINGTLELSITNISYSHQDISESDIYKHSNLKNINDIYDLKKEDVKINLRTKKDLIDIMEY